MALRVGSSTVIFPTACLLMLAVALMASGQ